MDLATPEEEQRNTETDERFAVEAIPHLHVLKKIARRMRRNRDEQNQLID